MEKFKKINLFIAGLLLLTLAFIFNNNYLHHSLCLHASRLNSCVVMTEKLFEAKNYNESLKYFKKLCDFKVNNCIIAGNKFSDINQHNIAIDFYQTSCDLDNFKACHNLATTFNEIKNRDKAIYYYEKSCNNNYYPSCFSLGNLYWNEKKYQKAIEPFSAGCNGDHAFSCTNLGFMYFKLNSNVSLQEFYDKKGCELGSHLGCYNVACDYCRLNDIKQATLAFEKFLNMSDQANLKELTYSFEDSGLNCLKDQSIWEKLKIIVAKRKAQN